ncbi:MAG: Holliday junction branch migration protein RuvA [Candidatus Falkowbacteria bacterium]
MIAFLQGKIINKGQGFVILQADNIGYQVFVNAGMYVDLSIGQEIELYVHHNVKEDAQDLYGFKNFNELGFFKLLISVSGVGPKSALGVLAMASAEEIKQSIAQGDPSLLNKVSGIGAKTAERIVLELRNKVDALMSVDSSAPISAMSINGDEIDALITLGYNIQQAREALKSVGPEITDSGERIRVALRGLG